MRTKSGSFRPSALRIPLAKILGPPLLVDTTAHLKWISKALDSEKRYLALFDQDGQRFFSIELAICGVKLSHLQITAVPVW